ncbi:MAG TPA: hypothetical protein VF616_27925 [Duganella sp.]|uniref:hypothetical protein n=1 Tax=Duganella sp. TaxID=1904440 RepID=UPI002ED602DC
MNPREKNQTEALAALSAADRACLERLAARADVSPEVIWPDVWLYGLDDVEEGIRADIEADEYFKSNVGIDNAEVMAEVRNLIAVHGKSNR